MLVLGDPEARASVKSQRQESATRSINKAEYISCVSTGIWFPNRGGFPILSSTPSSIMSVFKISVGIFGLVLGGGGGYLLK